MNGKILFVEDDQDDVFLIQRACQRAGIETPNEFLPNGKAALEVLSQTTLSGATRGVPKLIFLDLNMPLMGGLPFLKWLRGNVLLKGIPVVVLTTSENPDDVTAAHNAGASAYLVKPAALGEFAEMLGCAVHFWLNYNRAPAYGSW